MALVTGLLAWLVARPGREGRTGTGEATPAMEGRHGTTPASSPYATPTVTTQTPHPATPPFPEGGPLAGGSPAAPVSSGQDAAESGSDPEPPRGPRYDLPPPS